MINLALFLFLLPSISFAGGIAKGHDNCDRIPNGSICYDEASQVAIDEAIEMGLECEKNVAACRKWRDRYKSILSKEHAITVPQLNYDVARIEYQTEWTQNTWIKVIAATVIAFGIGVGVGVSF